MEKINLPEILRAIQIEAIKRALEASRGNVAHAASLLGIGRTALYQKILVLNLKPKLQEVRS